MNLSIAMHHQVITRHYANNVRQGPINTGSFKWAGHLPFAIQWQMSFDGIRCVKLSCNSYTFVLSWFVVKEGKVIFCEIEVIRSGMFLMLKEYVWLYYQTLNVDVHNVGGKGHFVEKKPTHFNWTVTHGNCVSQILLPSVLDSSCLSVWRGKAKMGFLRRAKGILWKKKTIIEWTLAYIQGTAPTILPGLHEGSWSPISRGKSHGF